MKPSKKGFTLIELLVVVAIIALLISILLPSLSRARELSKRLVCGSNVKGMGTAFKIYANENEEQWPTPPFCDETGTFITYNFEPSGTLQVGKPTGTTVGATPGREAMSTVCSTVTGAPAGTTTLSVTRALWMLVRSGDVTPKQFACPSSGDTADPEQNLDTYYDFTAYKNISYGYQVPFGPLDTRPSENIDTRLATAADKGVYSHDPIGSLPSPGDPHPTDMTKWSPQDWKEYNSPNHGGWTTGEGQNVLFGDGHSSFEKKPICGVDDDNIYTRMDGSQTGTDFLYGRYIGLVPGAADDYPGYQGLQVDSVTKDSNTDSLIYP